MVNRSGWSSGFGSIFLTLALCFTLSLPASTSAATGNDQILSILASVLRTFSQMLAVLPQQQQQVAAAGNNQYMTVQAFAPSERIDSLSNVSISNATVSGVSGLTSSDIPDLSSQYLPVTGGTISGSVVLTNATSTNFFSTTASSTNLFAQNATFGNLSAAGVTLTAPLPTNQGGTGTTTWQANSIPYFNGSYFTENNSLFNFNGIKLTASYASTTALNVSGTAYFPGSGIWTAGGFLGIGTTTPQWPLNILNASGPQLALSGTGTNIWTFREAGGNLYIATSSPTTFATSSVSAFSLSSNGILNLASALPITSGGTGNTTGIQFGVLYSTGSLATSTTIASAGSGYATGDSITVGGGTCSVAPVLSVESTTTNSSGVDLFQVTKPGVCTVIPPNPVGQGSTSGVGSGGTFNLSWGLIAANLSTATLGSSNGNLFIGAEQPLSSMIGAENTFIGDRAGGNFATSSSFNTAIGHNACGLGGAQLNAGSMTCIGIDSGRNIVPGAGGDVLIGANVGRNEGGIGDTFLGTNAGKNIFTGNGSTFIGNGAVSVATSGVSVFRNTIIGQNAGTAIAANDNVFIGDAAAATSTYNTTSASVIIGSAAAKNVSDLGGSVIIGYQALQNFADPAANPPRDFVAIGQNAMQNFNSHGGAQVVAIGSNSFQNLSTGNSGADDTALGFNSCKGASATVNVLKGLCLGANTGGAITGGSFFDIIGNEVANSTFTAPGNANDIFIGTGLPTVDAPVGNGNIQNYMNINNTIFATNMPTSGTTPGGNVGIATSTPYARLEVWGPDSGATTSAFLVANSASTTVFSVFDNGNATYAGSIFQSSDRRLKTNVQSLDGSSALSAIDALNPVSYTRLDQPGTGTNLGFLAQQVGTIFPQLVSTSSPTTLTPDGTLTLNYEGLIAPIVAAIQELSDKINGFAQSFTSAVGNFGTVNTNQLCVGSTCINQQQLAALLASQNEGSSGQGSSSSSNNPTMPPVLSINGENPAIIHIGDTYSDLGATITGPQADLNLGINMFVNGIAMSPVTIDTTQVATDTIDYVVSDSNGLTSTTTRTVLVQ